MKKTFITIFLAGMSILTCFAQTPDSITAPRVWLSADVSARTGLTWTDRSIFRNDAVSNLVSEAPTSYAMINFNKALIFDGLDDYFKIPNNLEGLAELSILCVFQSADTTERGIWGSEQATSRNILLTTRKAIGPDTISDVYGKYEKLTALNSVMQTWDNSTPVVGTNSYMALGSAGKSKPFKFFRGALAELIVFNRALTFLERVQFETYLAIKYGTGLNGGNFVSSNEKLLWHVSQNAAYGKNIAGIGRDDFFQLHQKQSGSAYDSGLLIMSAGVLASSNAANTMTLHDQDFILWGDNGQQLLLHQEKNDQSLLSIVDRKWLVTATGNSASRLLTNLYVDGAKLSGDPMDYWLVIDRTGQGNFSPDNLEYVLPEKIVDGKVVFPNVKWDTDGSSKDNFSFASAVDLFTVVRKLNDPLCTDETAGRVSIEMVKGKAPFDFTLKKTDGTIVRNWRTSSLSTLQAELTAGDYTVTVQDATRKNLTRQFSMNVPNALAIDLGPDRILDPATPLQLDISTQIPDSVDVSYRWENSFGFNSTEEKITVTESGIYRVFVTKHSDGCVFTDAIAINGAEAQRVSVYPTIIQSNDPYNVGISLQNEASVGVKIFNSRGILLETMEGQNQSEYQFITTVKDPGVYMIVIQTPEGIETRKLIAY
jgi:hypothetical protein